MQASRAEQSRARSVKGWGLDAPYCASRMLEATPKDVSHDYPKCEMALKQTKVQQKNTVASVLRSFLSTSLIALPKTSMLI
jgi:hypothetical protein